MRVSLRIDSATERELRDVLVAYNHATGETDGVKVGLNGPECYSAVTPPLKGRQAWALLDKLGDGTLLDGLVSEDHGDAEMNPFRLRASDTGEHTEALRRAVFGEAPDPATPEDGFTASEWAAAWGAWVT